jgi:hypothetical protein
VPGLASPLQLRHYYEEADPDRALAMLEEEMSDVTSGGGGSGSGTHAGDRSAHGLDKLRTLLERECEAQACSFIAFLTQIPSQLCSTFLLCGVRDIALTS